MGRCLCVVVREGPGWYGRCPYGGCILVSKEPRRVLQGWGLWGFLAGEQHDQICVWDNSSGHDGARKQSSLSGKESAQGCIPKRLLGRPD